MITGFLNLLRGLNIIFKTLLLTFLINNLHRILKKNGKLIFEIGAVQKKNIEKMLNKYGFYINKVIKDLASIPRIIVSTKLK